jgi:hypothetical protein
MKSNKRESKALSKGDLYSLPKIYNNTHEHTNGEFKNG